MAGVALFGACSPSSSTVIPGATGGATGATTGGATGTTTGGATGTGTGGATGAGTGGATGAGTGGATNTGGNPGSGGGTGTGGGDSGGSASGGRAAGGTGTAGTTGGGDGTAGTSGGGGAAVLGDLTKVVPTAGCGKDPGQAIGMAVRRTIATMGMKMTGCADSACGSWTYMREAFVTLPTGYDRTKAYPLVLQGPGCGATGTSVYPLTLNNVVGVGNSVIRVGLTPPPNAIGHATNPNEGCFDDKEGDDSVDWIFYENLYDQLATTVCFDRNRVFSVGNSSGSWFSNELGCKYAGDATRPVRGIMPNTGGLPTDVRYVPTCTTKPMSGMWIHETGDTTNPFTGNKVAIARAMKVNGCTIGTGYDDTMFTNYPIGGGNADTVCKKIMGCPELYPLVVCALPGNAHGSHDNVANPGFATFISSFSKAPLLVP
ncbi:MAG: hypothetical protein ABUL77_04475 [Bacteroidota bacterium]